MTTKWFEELPEQCPPEDAKVCNGIYFRIAMEIRLHLQISFHKGNYSLIRFLKGKELMNA